MTPLLYRSRTGAEGRAWGRLLAGLRWLSLALGLSLAGQVSAATPGLNEYEIKAAAFYNIIEFTNWPRDAFQTPTAPLVIGILGEGQIAALIEKLVVGETWRGHRIVVRRYRGPDDVQRCHVLFVARSQSENWSQIRQRFSNQPVLCVSDSDNFAAEGGNVQLGIDRNKLRIFVNLAATRARNLQLSSNLLRLATIVGPAPELFRSPRSGLRPVPTTWLAAHLAVLAW